MAGGFFLPAFASGLGGALEKGSESLEKLAEQSMKREQMQAELANMKRQSAIPRNVTTTPQGEMLGLVYDEKTGQYAMKPLGRVPVQKQQEIKDGVVWERSPDGTLRPVGLAPPKPLSDFQKQDLDLKQRQLTATELGRQAEREFKEKQLASTEALKKAVMEQTKKYQEARLEMEKTREADRELDRQRSDALKRDIANMNVEQRREAAAARKSNPAMNYLLRDSHDVQKNAREQVHIGSFVGDNLRDVEKHLQKASGWKAGEYTRIAAHHAPGLTGGLQDVATVEGLTKTVLAREDKMFGGLTGRLPYVMIQQTEGLIYSPGYSYERNLYLLGRTYERFGKNMEVTAKAMRDNATQLRTMGDVSVADSLMRTATELEAKTDLFMKNAGRILGMIQGGTVATTPVPGPQGAADRLRQKFGVAPGR